MIVGMKAMRPKHCLEAKSTGREEEATIKFCKPENRALEHVEFRTRLAHRKNSFGHNQQPEMWTNESWDPRDQLPTVETEAAGLETTRDELAELSGCAGCSSLSAANDALTASWASTIRDAIAGEIEEAMSDELAVPASGEDEEFTDTGSEASWLLRVSRGITRQRRLQIKTTHGHGTNSKDKSNSCCKP